MSHRRSTTLRAARMVAFAAALVVLAIRPAPAHAEWPHFVAADIQSSYAQIQDGCDDGVHCDATSPLSYVLDVGTQEKRQMLTWTDMGYNLSSVTWQLPLEVGHTYQIFMHNAAQPGSYSYSQQFVFDPTSFMATSAAVDHLTGQFSFDYHGYHGGGIVAVSLRYDRLASVYNWPAGEIGYGPLSCSASHCSGTPSHLTGAIACSDSLVFDIYDGSGEYISNTFTVAHIDPSCQVPVPGPDWPTFQKNAQHTGFAESETVLSPQLVTLWSADTPAVNYQSMIVAGGVMYVGVSAGILSIDVSDGSVNWSVSTSATERLTYADGVLYSVGGCANCSVEARNPGNGQLIWSSVGYGGGVSSGVTAGGDRLYIGTGDHQFRALDASTGAQVWGYPLADPMFGWPALMGGNDDIVYVGSYQNSPNQLALHEASPGAGTALWSTNRLLGASTPTALNGRLYWANSGSSGMAVAFDANNGGQQWNNFSVLGGTTATAVAYNTVYVRGHGGRVTAIDADTGQTKWTYNDGANGDLHTPVVVANNVVYEATFDGKINALAAQTGALLWQYTGTSKVTALIVADHKLLAGTENGKILAFGPPVTPSTPTVASVTPGNHSATVTWLKPPDGGSPILGYTVTASPGGQTCSTNSADDLSCTITGLTNGVNYTFVVTAHNAVGDSPPPGNGGGSGPGTPTGTGTPGAPPGPVTGVEPVPDPSDGTRVTLHWLPAASELPITGYRASAEPGGQFCTTDGALFCTITGLDPNQNYAFTVVAINGAGPSEPSDPVGIAPTVSAVTPAHGTVSGGTSVTVDGTHLAGATAVRFGNADAATFAIISDTRIVAVAPAGSGTVDVTVTTPAGTSATTPADRYTYDPSADLDTKIATSTGAVSLGDAFTTTVTVTNHGPSTATQATTTVTLSGATATLLNSSIDHGSCVTGGNALTCTIGTLANGASANIVVSIEPAAAGTATVHAVTVQSESDPQATNNSATATITVTNDHGCTIIGTTGNDTINGTNGNDVICGLAGDDTINGGNGNDVIYGGAGNDTLDGGNGDDTIYAGDSGSVLIGGNGNDTLTGGSGNDTIYGDNGNDTINAGPGNDTISGGNGNDTINAGPGDDTVDGGNGTDTCANTEHPNSCA